MSRLTCGAENQGTNMPEDTNRTPEPPSRAEGSALDLTRAIALDLLQVVREYAYWHIHSSEAGIYNIIRQAEQILGLPERVLPENDYVWKVPESMEKNAQTEATPPGSVQAAGSEVPSLTWIRNALCAGGTLKVKSIMPGKSIFSARMTWPGESDIVGNISTTIVDALRNLDGMLMEDAAQEMVDKGAV